MPITALVCKYPTALSRIRRLPGWLFAAALVGAIAAGPVLAGSATERINVFLKGINSLQADFKQHTFNADRSQMTEADGTVYLQRPDRFRWVYERPLKQVIIADGQRVYLHDLDLEQVSQRSQDKALRGTPALVLISHGPIEQYFKVRAIDSSDGRDWFELVPKERESDVTRIEIGLGQRDLESLIMVDAFGQETRLDFSHTRRNLRLDPKLFRIERSAVSDFIDFD